MDVVVKGFGEGCGEGCGEGAAVRGCAAGVVVRRLQWRTMRGLTLLVVPEQMASGLWKRRPRLTSMGTPLSPTLLRPKSPTCT